MLDSETEPVANDWGTRLTALIANLSRAFLLQLENLLTPAQGMKDSWVPPSYLELKTELIRGFSVEVSQGFGDVPVCVGGC